MNFRDEIRNGKNICDLNLRVCYYARVSTDQDLQATSIVNQRDYFTKYIGGVSNWKFTQGYVDEGVSGKSINKRENFLRMIEDGKRGMFDLVLTKSVSRFARNTIDSINYTNLLLDRGIGVFFINDNINTFSLDSEFRLTLMASIAQDELRKLSGSVKFGLRQSINRGVVLGNDNILGYKKDNGSLVIVNDEAIVVREIFRLFDEVVHNYSEIARRINKEYGYRFNSSSIKRILTNYKYKGFYCGKKSEVIDYKRGNRRYIDEGEWVIYRDYERVPLIVDEDLWDRVNEVIRDKITYRDNDKCLVFCMIHGECLSKRKVYMGKEYRYYICKSCFRLSSRLLKKIVKGRVVERVIIKVGEKEEVRDYDNPEIEFGDDKIEKLLGEAEIFQK